MGPDAASATAWVVVIVLAVVALAAVAYWGILRRAGWRPGWRPGDPGWGMRRWSPLSFAIATAVVGLTLLVILVVR